MVCPEPIMALADMSEFCLPVFSSGNILFGLIDRCPHKRPLVYRGGGGGGGGGGDDWKFRYWSVWVGFLYIVRFVETPFAFIGEFDAVVNVVSVVGKNTHIVFKDEYKRVIYITKPNRWRVWHSLRVEQLVSRQLYWHIQQTMFSMQCVTQSCRWQTEASHIVSNFAPNIYGLSEPWTTFSKNTLTIYHMTNSSKSNGTVMIYEIGSDVVCNLTEESE